MERADVPETSLLHPRREVTQTCTEREDDRCHDQGADDEHEAHEGEVALVAYHKRVTAWEGSSQILSVRPMAGCTI